MKILYIDCFSGIAGDMFAAAMTAAGVREEMLTSLPARLGLANCRVVLTDACRGGISGKHFSVEAPEKVHAHETFAEIKALFAKSALSGEERALALRIFSRVAEAEGKIHGRAPDEVHFHEVGATDSIVDIAAAAVCVCALKPGRIVFSPLTEGSGTVVCAHGALPVPCPATAEILRAGKVPFRCIDAGTELVTPTGAAIAAELASAFGPMPAMTAGQIGYGCGTKELSGPNVLRAVLGETAEGGPENRVAVLETYIDDSTGEELGFCAEKLMEVGALDACFAPVYMKKGRPAWALTVLCREAEKERFAALVFRHTGSIGMRTRVSDRIVMNRRSVKVATKYGDIACKICEFGGIVKGKPEYEALKKAAGTCGLPIDEVRRTVKEALPEYENFAVSKK